MSSFVSQFFVLSLRGDVIVSRDYRSDVARNSSETFFRKVKLGFTDGDEAPPIFHIDGVNFVHVKSGGLLFVVTSRNNLAPALAIELLHRVARVIKDYCGVLNEDALRKNFVLVYELLDELIDYGYAQTTSTETLKKYVFNDATTVSAPSARGAGSSLFAAAKRIGGSAINRSVLSNEREGGTARDEIFVDIIEKLSVVFNASGHVLTSEIDGAIQMKSYLRGNPEIRVALNQDVVVSNREGASGGGYGGGVGVVLDDCSFHECVRLDDFDASRTIQMVPPDGEFDVMRYRTTQEFRPPLRLFPLITEREPGSFGIDFALKLRADFPQANSASSVTVRVPLPRSCTRAGADIVSAQAAGQSWEFDEAKRCLVWKLSKVVGGSEHTINARLTLSAAATGATRREIGPVSCQFTVPMYNVSKLQVRYLQIMKRSKDYKPYRWVRYISQSNNYVCRL